MNVLILNQSKRIIVDGDERVCVFTLPSNIDQVQIFNDKAIIIYTDGTPNSRINDVTTVPKYSELMQAYYDVKKLDPPTIYHTWNETSKDFEITSENLAQQSADAQAVLDAIEALEVAQAIKDAEIANNPLASITFEQAETWINTNVVDLPSAKEAMKKIVKLILART